VAEEREILRYELDLADVEAKAQRLRVLTEQMRAATAKGENTDELQQQIQNEVNALASMGAEQKKAASTTEELIRSKEKLTSVVALMGGTFGGTVGQIANMIGMLVAANPAIAAVAAGLAGLTLGLQVYESLAEAAKKAREEQEKYNEAVAAGQQLRQKEAASVADKLEAWGRRSNENVLAALELKQGLQRRWGVPTERATQAGALAAAAGLGEEDAARLSVLLGHGAKVDTPEQAREALFTAEQAGKSDLLLSAAEQYARDIAGQQVRIEAMTPGQPGMAGMSPERAAYEALKAQPGGLAASGIPADLTFDEFRQVRAGDWTAIARAMFPGNQKLTRSKMEEVRRVANGAQNAIVAYIEQVSDIQMGSFGGAGPAFNAPSDYIGWLDRGRLAMGLAPQAEGDLGAQVRGAVQIINNTNVGTSIQLDTNRKIRTPGSPRMGGSDGDVLTPY